MTRIKTLIVFCFICVHPCLSVAAIDYSKFSHATPKHRAACNTCHKIAFPDINDYPSHNACVSCHRSSSRRTPPICSVCHSKTSPRDEALCVFRNPASKLQFTIEFPHDKHQDVIAMLRFSHAPQNYYNCTVCHGQRTATSRQCRPIIRRASTVTGNRSNPSRTTVTAVISLRRLTRAPAILRGSRSSLFMKAVARRNNTSRNVRRMSINIKAASLRGLKPDVPITGVHGMSQQGWSQTGSE